MPKPRILVIEDDDAVRATVVALLTRNGYEPVEAIDGAAGLEVFRRARVDLVITDVIMPEQEGIETILQIRELDPDVPIIAISGSGTENFSPLHDAALMGASRTLGKPFEVAELLRMVKELVA